MPSDYNKRVCNCYCSYYETRSVLIALVITVGVCLAISLFAIQVRVSFITPPLIVEYCDKERVCLCVCLSVRDHIFRTTLSIFTNFFAHATYDRGSVLRWRRSDKCYVYPVLLMMSYLDIS